MHIKNEQMRQCLQSLNALFTLRIKKRKDLDRKQYDLYFKITKIQDQAPTRI